MLVSEYIYKCLQFFMPLFANKLCGQSSKKGKPPYDFFGVNSNDIVYPQSTVINLDTSIQHQTLLIQSSFLLS